MLKKIIAICNTLSKEEQKFVTGGTTFMHAGGGDKQKGELCLKGYSQPHLSCADGLTCKSSGHTGVGLCE